jgi:hypothetical protein
MLRGSAAVLGHIPVPARRRRYSATRKIGVIHAVRLEWHSPGFDGVEVKGAPLYCRKGIRTAKLGQRL